MKPTLALLGAGLFVRSDYVASLRELKELVTLGAIWSRSEASAVETAKLVSDFAPDVAVKWGEAGLNEILLEETIHSVAVVLSAQVQLDIVQKALEAGKHVLQEKPVGSCVSEVRDVFATYKSLSLLGGELPIWSIAENFRFEKAINEAASWVKEIGELTLVSVTFHEPVNEDNAYYTSVTESWRKVFKGGLSLDGGVHCVAGTKMITGHKIKSVAGIARHIDKRLPPPDSVTSLFELSNGCSGLLSMSWNGALKEEVVWRVLGTKGEVRVERVVEDGKTGYRAQLIYADGRDPESHFYPTSGVTEELRAFSADVAMFVFEGVDASTADPRGSVEEAINDVAVIEAIFKSSCSIQGLVDVEQLDFRS